MKIAVDICNTLADINQVIEHMYGRNPNPRSYFHPAVSSKYFFSYNTWIFAVAKPMVNSVAILQLLVEQGHEIVYITARPEEAMEITETWLRRNGYPEGEIHYTTNKTKVEICKELGIQVAIDDAPHEINEYTTSDIEVFIPEQEYNVQFRNRFNWNNLSFLAAMTRSVSVPALTA